MRISTLFSRVLPGFRTRIKSLMPRTLYGRAALILVVPIVTIQLVVSIVFIQRHYDDVTRQMTGNVVRELTWVMERVEAAETQAQAERLLSSYQVPFAFEATWGQNSAGTMGVTEGYIFYDLSAKVVIEVLRSSVEGISLIDLKTDKHQVTFLVQSGHGPVRMSFSRLRVSAPNPHQLLVLMVVTSLLMTGVAYIFMRNQMRPIKKLASASEAFGKGQWMDYSPSGATEVRAAGGAFLAMRSRIERQIEQRTMMLSGVSHDLRTPLTRLKLSLSMIDDEEEAQAMREDVTDMERLIDSFLDFARGDADDTLSNVDPVALAKSCVEKVRGHDGALHFLDMPKRALPGVVKMREQAMIRALDNLISNGLRYGTQVQVSVLMLERSFVFRVEDNGPGIAPEKRADAVKPFVRLEEARNQNKDSAGTGLGLAIAFDIARTHGGSLRLGESPNFGGLMAELIIAR